MIEIHWLWLPLIITLLSSFIAYIFEGREVGPLSFITGIIGCISLIIYVITGIAWLFSHINIIR
jgi:hypothetical protein